MEINLCYNCMAPKEGDGPCPRCGFDERTYEPSPYHLRPGTILAGKYLLGRVLSEGNSGITYISWDLNRSEKTAVREFFPLSITAGRDLDNRLNVTALYNKDDGKKFEEGKIRFAKIAYMLQNMNLAAGILPVWEVLYSNHTIYRVSDFIEGWTFSDLYRQMPQKRVEPVMVFGAVKTVLDALGNVHRRGILHLNINMDGIFVDLYGRGWILNLDTGERYMLDKFISVPPLSIPEDGIEMYLKKGAKGPWTDIYALCAVMYQVMSGQPIGCAIDRMEKDYLKPLSALGINISSRQERALMRGLAIQGEKRWQCIEDFYWALYR